MASEGLYAAVVRLRARDAAAPAHGRMAHAAFLDWIAAGSPELAAALHAGQGQRPFTVALLPGRPPGGRDLLLRCTMLRDDAFAAFTQRLRAPDAAPVVRLGAAEYEVMEVTTRPGPEGWSGQTTWRALAEGALAERRLALEFATPTCFSRGTVDGRQRVELFPQPEWAWESWARKWSAAAPEPLDARQPAGQDAREPADLDARAVADLAARWALVADYDLTTRTLDYGRHKQKGFVGRVRYELAPQAPEEAVRRLNLLAAFAFYAGTGYKTAMGLGLTRRLPA